MATPRRAPKRPGAVAAEAPTGAAPSSLVVLIALAALNIAIYAAVRSFEFTNWDDADYVLENVRVQAGLSASNVWWALTTGHPP
ncbi:MAG: hypothetical protein KAY59_12175, partial [Acidobacteria bacterium]|nr:hypothetical protein [Acidobacteriota bacterium]